jgi:hypothetical protein
VAPKCRRWKPDEDKLLGTLSDAEIGRRLGRNPKVVGVRRRQLGLVAVRYWRPEDDRLLGTVSDKEVARRLGRSLRGVIRRRVRLRIPAWRPK